MSVAWKDINPVLISLFTDLVRNEEAQEWDAQWMERPRTFTNPIQGGDLLLKVTTCVGIGEDERRLVERNGELYETVVGQRRFTLQVQARSTEHTDEIWAMQTLERVRTRLRWRSSLDRLLSVQVSLIDILPALKASAVIDKRIWSIGNMDVIFGTVACDEDPIPVGWIEHIHVRTCIRASDQPLPSPPNNGPGERIPPLPGAP